MITEDDVERRMPNGQVRGLLRGCRDVREFEPVLAPQVVAVEKSDPFGVDRFGHRIASEAEVASVYSYDRRSSRGPLVCYGLCCLINTVECKHEIRRNRMTRRPLHRSPGADYRGSRRGPFSMQVHHCGDLGTHNLIVEHV